MPQSGQSIRIKDKEAAQLLGIGRSNLWRWARERSDFPQPRRDGGRCTYWLRHEIESYALGTPSSSQEQEAC